MAEQPPRAVPVSVVRAVRDAGSARQSGPLICILVLGCRRSSISTHVSSVSHVSQSSSWHSSVSHVSHISRGTWSSRCMQRRRHTLRTTPTTDTPRTMGAREWEAIAHDRASRRKHSPHRWGGRQNPTHTGAAQTPYTSALARCGRRSPLGPISIFSTAACGHAPRRAGLGGRPRSRTRCGHARWLRWLRA